MEHILTIQIPDQAGIQMITVSLIEQYISKSYSKTGKNYDYSNLRKEVIEINFSLTNETGVLLRMPLGAEMREAVGIWFSASTDTTQENKLSRFGTNAEFIITERI